MTMEPAVAGAQVTSSKSHHCVISVLLAHGSTLEISLTVPALEPASEERRHAVSDLANRGVMMKCLSFRIPGIHQRFLPELHGFLPHLGRSSDTVSTYC